MDRSRQVTELAFAAQEMEEQRALSPSAQPHSRTAAQPGAVSSGSRASHVENSPGLLEAGEGSLSGVTGVSFSLLKWQASDAGPSHQPFPLSDARCSAQGWGSEIRVCVIPQPDSALRV